MFRDATGNNAADTIAITVEGVSAWLCPAAVIAIGVLAMVISCLTRKRIL